MWLKNSDKEVECFHPVCKEAFEAALKQLNLDDTYEVQHHRYVGSIEMDLVIANKTTNKILCVIEVKRTMAAVNSTRYQYQAMSYVQSLREAELESRYYILTNLESSCLFKFDRNRPNVYEQIIEPGISVNHLFSDVGKELFMADLIQQYVGYIDIILHDSGKYLLSFKQFADEIQDKLNTDNEWKSALVALFYEYIRGSFSKVDRGNLRTIAQLSNKLDLICREGLKINFKDIFTLPEFIMNPPYLAATGVKCSERKAELYKRIRQLKGTEPTTINGQMPLEGPFVELVSTLAKDGTVIAAILPNTHFTTKGEASKAIRTMLLNDFGLQMIFNYPQERLFEEVAQNTSIVIGVKGSQAENIRYLYSNEVVSQIDTSSIGTVLSSEFSLDGLANIDNQFEGCLMTREELVRMVDSGWQIGNMAKRDAQNFIQANIASSNRLVKLADSEFKDYKRGKIGNEGCTDLLFLDPKNTFLKEVRRQVRGHLSVGLNNADYESFFVGKGDSLFFNVEGMSDLEIRQIVDKCFEAKGKKMNKQGQNKDKKQRRDEKPPEKYVAVLKKESKKVSPINSVLLPRAIRSSGRVFISTQPTFVSTNFFVFPLDEQRSTLLASWFSTIFFQLECEAYHNNRSGMRKLEQKDYNAFHVPVTSELTEDEKQRVISTPISEFVNLRSPQIREVDRVWADILFGENADELIEEALTLVPILVADREK